MDKVPAKTTACVLRKVNDMCMEERPTPTPGPQEVLIAVRSVGICGSDVHYWTNGRIGPFVLTAPMILGHESAGEVVAVGAKVTNVKPGDRITMEPGVPCRFCVHCKTGRYNMCPDIMFMATPPYDGSLSNYIVWPSDFCFKLPDNVSYDEGAMCEPLSVGVHAVTRAGVCLGQTVLITGSGPIGLMSLVAAKAAGAGEVIVADIKPERLEVAKRMGATHTVDLSQLQGDAVVQRILQLAGPGGVHTTIECSGADSAITTGIRATTNGGVMVLVGLGGATTSVPLVEAAVREVDIRGVFRYANTYPKALALIASGKVDVKQMITHHFPFAEAEKAFTISKNGKDEAGKMSIKTIITL